MLKAGMDDFVGKPYRPDEIYACLAKQLGMVFRYEGEAEPQVRSLTPEMLSVLPATLRAQLREAVQSLDVERIGLVLRQVAAHDQQLQQTLEQLTKDFDYPAIVQALNDAEGSASTPNADSSS
jgi:DNA-binding response OmpR family regulator